MRAAVFNGPGEIDIEAVPEPEVESPRGAVVRVTHTAVCGSDLWFCASEADGTLVRVPDRHADDEATLQALLPLTDVMGTGHHAALSAGVGEGDTAVVVGDGAVGLCAVLAARRLGAERIVAMGHHEDRLAIAEEFGATETVSERGEAAVERATELSGGVAPVRAYAEELMADVLGGRLDPSPIFTKTVDLDGVPEGYRAMDEREVIKVMVRL